MQRNYQNSMAIKNEPRNLYEQCPCPGPIEPCVNEIPILEMHFASR